MSRAPPSSPSVGAGRSSAPRSASAATFNASDHVASARSSPGRAPAASASRPSLLIASKSKRPLSHSQPQLTGSRSTPWQRSTRLRLDSTVMRQPTEHDRARRLDLLEVPRPGLEAVRLGRERADRADLHGVAPEVRRERVVGEGVDLGLVAPALEVDERIARDLLGEARAAVAEDAALAVEQHEVADRDRLLEVPLLLDEPALARPVGVGVVLQRALAALVADRAVERVVDEQELEDAVLRLLRGRRLGVDDHAVGDRDHAARLQRRPAAGVDVDDAHAAHADRPHPRVVAEARDVDAGPLGGVDHELALGAPRPRRR